MHCATGHCATGHCATGLLATALRATALLGVLAVSPGESAAQAQPAAAKKSPAKPKPKVVVEADEELRFEVTLRFLQDFLLVFEI